MAEQLIQEADQGAVIRLAVGDTLAVELAEAPTSGARWRIHAKPGGFRLVADRFEASSATPGSGGMRRLEFLAEAADEGELDLGALAHPNGEAIPDRTLSVRVQIRS